MIKIDDLPDGFSKKQIEPLNTEYDQLMQSLDEKSKALDQAQ